MTRKNLLVAASLLLLATACTEENYPVVPTHRVTEVSSPEPVLLIPLNDSVYVDKGKNKPVQVATGVPASAYHSAVMPEEVFGDK